MFMISQAPTRADDGKICLQHAAMRGRASRLCVVAALSTILGILVSGCGASHVAKPEISPATELPSNYSVEYDSLFQTPRYISNSEATGSAHPGEPAPYSDAVAFQIVQQFVVLYAPVFHFRTGIDGFVAVWAQGHDGINFVKIQQTYRGLPVDVMGYGTSVLPDRSIGSMIGRFMPGITVSITPGIHVTVADATAIDALAPTVVHVASLPTLMITTYDTTPRLTWAVTVLADGSFFSWTVMVDARTGAALGVHPNFIIG